MVWYRSSKQTNQSIPWSKGEMQLPFEDAYEHGIGRSWNNMTAAKVKELESAMGKDAAKLAIEREGRVKWWKTAEGGVGEAMGIFWQMDTEVHLCYIYAMRCCKQNKQNDPKFKTDF